MSLADLFAHCLLSLFIAKQHVGAISVVESMMKECTPGTLSIALFEYMKNTPMSRLDLFMDNQRLTSTVFMVQKAGVSRRRINWSHGVLKQGRTGELVSSAACYSRQHTKG